MGKWWWIVGIIIVISSAVFISTQVVNGQPVEELLDYCYEHADRPNPIQDLIDKGFLSETFKGETCKSVGEMYNEVKERFDVYLDCLEYLTNTNEKCTGLSEPLKQ
ncbi:MAG TPA: hypothetical protein VIP29_06125 [Nitrososphaeraceae archaeon]